MDWSTPPTFAAGSALSATDLNVIRDDLLYLYGKLFHTAPAMVEREDYVTGVQDSWKEAVRLWIDHKGSKFYYRIRVMKDASEMGNVSIRLRYYTSAGVLKGTHTEGLSTPTHKVWYTATNSNAVVEISGWSLTLNTLYQIVLFVKHDKAEGTGRVYWETSYMYEQA